MKWYYEHGNIQLIKMWSDAFDNINHELIKYIWAIKMWSEISDDA